MRAERLLTGAWLPLVFAVLASCQFPNYSLPPDADGLRPGQSGAASGMSSGAVGGSEGATGGSGPGGAGDGPACPAADACVQALPSGWLGPVAFWKADSGAQAPACPDGYEAPSDFHASANGEPASCDCKCSPQGQSCSGNNDVVVYLDLGCQTPCFTATTASCTAITGCSGNQGSIKALPAEPVGGSCQAKVTKSTEPPSWGQDARLCTLRAAGDACGSSGETCAPTPGAPFASQLCVYRVVLPGQPLPTCPDAFPNGPEALYTELTDERECGACQCSAPQGGSCGGTVSLAMGDVCDEDFEYQLGSGCKQFMLTTGPKQMSSEYELTAGSCGISKEPGALGAVLPTGNAHVVCCP